MPLGVYDRDLVQYISHRRDKKLDYILYKNATDDRCPEQPGLINWLTPWLVGLLYVAPLGALRLRPPLLTQTLYMTNPCLALYPSILALSGEERWMQT